ncbi:hypothetical protein [Azospirillum sp. TSO35-2]|uniref:hypothetical protein n=1 Tax=Azospirillum sp. TSO35-2 TaxID=716796 RepID=UPI000D60C452|nr:hypothetical protein [Azospirillum sp. TSO35-2]PWC40315.1 hypothetical protein TSO352_01350 [Azospirillum sp. TSO35-2]
MSPDLSGDMSSRFTVETAADRTAGRGAALARGLLRLLLGVGALIVAYQCAMNLHASSGLPYWDDWGYFFGAEQGVQQPLTLHSIFAKDSDHVAPLFKLLTHGLWHAIGVDFIAFRLLGWLAFAAMLASYAVVLLRDCVRPGWTALPVAAAGLFLTGTLNNEYFYFQHMGLAQPIFFTGLFLFLHSIARGRAVLATLFLLAFGSTGVFGASYTLGAAGVGTVLALRQGGSWRDRLGDRRTLVAVGGGLLLTAAMLWMTFSGSYANHTGQPLVGPWQPEFWGFLFSAFATAAGLPVETVGMPLSLAVGVGAFALCLIPAAVLPFGRAGVERRHAVFCIASLVAGAVIVTMTTAFGRAGLCGDGIAAAMRCGLTPRYAYPVLLVFPAAIAGWILLAGKGTGRGAAIPVGLVLVALLALGHGAGGGVLRHWRVSAFNRMVAERDAEAQRCVAAHLQTIRTPAGLDWTRPLVCPSTSPRNITPFLHAAYDLKADFLGPILADAASRPERSILQTLLRDGRLDGPALRLDMPLPAAGANVGLNGSLDRIERILNGPIAAIGWAADMAVMAPATFVLATLGDRTVAVGSTGGGRSDVAAAFHDERLANSGFLLPLPADAAGQRVRLFVMAHSGALKELTPPSGVVVPAAP